MKKLIFTSLMTAAVMFANSAMADDDATNSNDQGKGKRYRKEKGKGRDGKMGMLTPEKREKVKAIMDSMRKESESLRKEMQALRAKMEALRDKKMQEIKSVLTEEEFKKFQEAMKRRRKHNGPEGKGERRRKKSAEGSDES